MGLGEGGGDREPVIGDQGPGIGLAPDRKRGKGSGTSSPRCPAGRRGSNTVAAPFCNQGLKGYCKTPNPIANPRQMHIPPWLQFRLHDKKLGYPGISGNETGDVVLGQARDIKRRFSATG